MPKKLEDTLNTWVKDWKDSRKGPLSADERMAESNALAASKGSCVIFGRKGKASATVKLASNTPPTPKIKIRPRLYMTVKA